MASFERKMARFIFPPSRFPDVYLWLPTTNAIILFAVRPLICGRILKICEALDCLSMSVTGIPGRLFIENKDHPKDIVHLEEGTVNRNALYVSW